MSDSQDFLTDGDLGRIERLFEVLNRSSIDYLQINVRDLTITMGKGEMPGAAAAAAPVPAPAAQAAPAATPTAPAVSAPAAAVEAAPAAPTTADVAGPTIDAPMMGHFYSRPEEGAAPFISVGDVVTPDTTVCLIEVMKTFASVPAGVSGTVVEILVQDEDIVEFGQPLFKIAAE